MTGSRFEANWMVQLRDLFPRPMGRQRFDPFTPEAFYWTPSCLGDFG